jgi:hypothetical protein
MIGRETIHNTAILQPQLCKHSWFRTFTDSLATKYYDTCSVCSKVRKMKKEKNASRLR